jgi:hypothetical protein
MHNSDRKPVVEFVVITEDFYRFKIGTDYQNAN